MKYEITEEQIKELAKGNAKVKKMFPEVFELKLEIGKWYKVKRDFKNELEAIVFFQGIDKETFGFSHGGKWTVEYGSPNDTFCNKNYVYIKATDSEVLEALTNEAKKRGFVKGAYVKDVNNYSVLGISKCEGEIKFHDEDLQLLSFGECNGLIFRKGVWSEIVKTYTKEEAEKMLNAKIV